MSIEEFNNLKPGDTVFAVINTGMTGISEYQYIGVFKCHIEDNTYKHVFLSPYFLSTILCTKGMENSSRTPRKLFTTKDEAVIYKAELKKTGNASGRYLLIEI